MALICSCSNRCAGQLVIVPDGVLSAPSKPNPMNWRRTLVDGCTSSMRGGGFCVACWGWRCFGVCPAAGGGVFRPLCRREHGDPACHQNRPWRDDQVWFYDMKRPMAGSLDDKRKSSAARLRELGLRRRALYNEGPSYAKNNLPDALAR